MKRQATAVLQRPRTLIVGVQAPYNPIQNIDSYFEEFKNLVHSSGREYDFEFFIKLRATDTGYFLTKGKLEELITFCAEKDIEVIIFSEALSAMQERNLEDILHCPIIDRTLLILEIFERGATSAEGKKQVALARLEFDKSRLAGRGIGMSQQTGRIGVRGPGETQKEKETQHIERLAVKLKRDLVKLEQIRHTQRQGRLQSGLPLLCLIGYTNAGKSTILNALTKSAVLAENKLFSTLDTSTRELYIDNKKQALISDTVGFIQQLPHHLVNAFKSTLAELEYADLLLHVVDIADPNWQEHCMTVHSVLEELDIHKPMLYIFNKIDKIDPSSLKLVLERYKPYVLVSAKEDFLKPLIEYLSCWLADWKAQHKPHKS